MEHLCLERTRVADPDGVGVGFSASALDVVLLHRPARSIIIHGRKWRTLSQEGSVRISLDVPEEYVLDQGPAEVARRLKLNAALLMFRAGEISAGGATQLAGVDRFTFAAECKRHGIPLVDYDPDELRDELDAGRRAS